MEGSRFLRNNNSSYGFGVGLNTDNTILPMDNYSIQPTEYTYSATPNISEGMGFGVELGQTPTTSRFGFDKGTISAIGTGMQGLGALANAYLGYKNYQQSKKQFGFEKAAFNRNIANQSALINARLASAANIAAQMSTPSTASPEERARIREEFLANQTRVDGSRVG